MTNDNLAELNLYVGELMDNVDIEDCVSNLTIGYLRIWIHTIEQNSKKVMQLSRFQEKMLDRYHATTAQVAEAFSHASDIFTQYTGIDIPQAYTTPYNIHQPTGAYALTIQDIPITGKVYLN